MAISLSETGKKRGKIKITTKIFWNLLGFFLLALFIFGLLQLYNRYLEAKIQETKIAIQEIDSKRDKELEKKMKNTLDVYEKVSPALDSHTRSRKILDFLEKNNYKGVSFSSFDYDLKEKNFSVNAVARVASDLMMQLTVFQKNKNIESVETENFSIEEKGVNIQIKAIFNLSLLKF